MATLPVLKTLTVNDVGEGPAGFSQFGVGYLFPTQPDHGDGTLLANYYATVIVPHVSDMQSNTYSQLQIEMHDNLTPEVFTETFPLVAPVPGTVADTICDNTTSPLISWRSTHAGRSYRGRSYIPAPAEEQVTQDVPDSSTTSFMANIIADVLAVASALDIPGAAIVSKHLGLATLITEGIARTIVGSQSRRKKGVGE